jgi:hypothetical protein
MAIVPWSDADDVRLRELARSGIGLVEIAAHMGRTKGAIRARVEKLNIAVARQQNPMQVGKKLSKGETAN